MASVANTMMTPVDATIQAVQKPFKKSKSEQIEQELPVEEPVEE